AFERLRATLEDELGTDPSPETRQLHLAILRDEEPQPEAPDAAQPFAPADPDFVGREAELTRLSEAWVEATSAHPVLLLICGEAGIGKTRLAEEAVALAARTGALVARARCYEAERSLFLEPILDALRTAAA